MIPFPSRVKTGRSLEVTLWDFESLAVDGLQRALEEAAGLEAGPQKVHRIHTRG